MIAWSLGLSLGCELSSCLSSGYVFAVFGSCENLKAELDLPPQARSTIPSDNPLLHSSLSLNGGFLSKLHVRLC